MSSQFPPSRFQHLFDVTGARVILHGRNASALAETAELIETEAGASALIGMFGVTDKDAAKRGTATLFRDYGVPDILINIASVQSQLARQTIAPHSATKGGVAQLTKGMAADLARHNIQVNAISPGYFATEMNRDLVADEHFDSWLRPRTPAGRWGSFGELPGVLLFLSSEASSFVSGQNIFLDGGMSAVV